MAPSSEKGFGPILRLAVRTGSVSKSSCWAIRWKVVVREAALLRRKVELHQSKSTLYFHLSLILRLREGQNVMYLPLDLRGTLRMVL